MRHRMVAYGKWYNFNMLWSCRSVEEFTCVCNMHKIVCIVLFCIFVTVYVWFFPLQMWQDERKIVSTAFLVLVFVTLFASGDFIFVEHLRKRVLHCRNRFRWLLLSICKTSVWPVVWIFFFPKKKRAINWETIGGHCVLLVHGNKS